MQAAPVQQVQPAGTVCPFILSNSATAKQGAEQRTQPQDDIIPRPTTTAMVVVGSFAILSVVLGLAVLVLNAVSVSDGKRIRSPSTSDDPVSPYSGVWYGGLNVVLSSLAILYCRGVVRKITSNPSPFPFSKTTRAMGVLLSVTFGLLAIAGLIAVGFGSFTIGSMSYSDDMWTTCSYDDTSQICTCGHRKLDIVKNVPSCDYVFDTLLILYRGTISLSVLSVVVNLAISLMIVSRTYAMRRYLYHQQHQQRIIIKGILACNRPHMTTAPYHGQPGVAAPIHDRSVVTIPMNAMAPLPSRAHSQPTTAGNPAPASGQPVIPVAPAALPAAEAAAYGNQNSSGGESAPVTVVHETSL